MEDPSYEYLLEEIRNESIMFTSMCNCQPGNDGEPCPHGHFSEVQMQTEAEWAKEQLKDWEYEPDEDEDDDEEFELDLELPDGGNNIGSTPGVSESEDKIEWYFDESEQEWKMR